MAKLTFIYGEEDYGTFQELDNENEGCTFVLVKGVRKGHLCGRPITFSETLVSFIPACSNHLSSYEYYLFNGGSEDDICEYKADDALSLNSIPKAIERSTECVVCLESVDPLLLPCGHTTCFTCIGSLRKKTCPMCRTEFKNEQLKRL